jgi:hypothetical protein
VLIPDRFEQRQGAPKQQQGHGFSLASGKADAASNEFDIAAKASLASKLQWQI